MPNLAKPTSPRNAVKFAQKNSTMASSSDASANNSGAARYFRSAFKALVRPVRTRKDVEKLRLQEQYLSKTWSMEYYSVDEGDSEVYHSYLGSLRRSELDASPATHVQTQSRLISELPADTEHTWSPVELADTSDLYVIRQTERERQQRTQGTGSPTEASTVSRFMATPTAIQSTALTSPSIRKV
jgi:hypothetical protein